MTLHKKKRAPVERRRFLSQEDEQEAQKLDCLRVSLNAVAKQVAEATAKIKKQSTGLADSQVESGQFRLERAFVGLVSHADEMRLTSSTEPEAKHFRHHVAESKAAMAELSDLLCKRRSIAEGRESALSEVTELYEQQTSLAAEELHMWISAHRRASKDLCCLQSQHASVAMYAARAVRERKEWQLNHGTSHSVDSTGGFIGRCKQLMAQITPQQHRFGDDAALTAEKFSQRLREGSYLYPQPGTQEELRMLGGLVDSLVTGVKPGGEHVSLEIVKARHAEELKEREALWSTLAQRCLSEVTSIRTLVDSVRQTVLSSKADFDAACHQLLEEVSRARLAAADAASAQAKKPRAVAPASTPGSTPASTPAFIRPNPRPPLEERAAAASSAPRPLREALLESPSVSEALSRSRGSSGGENRSAIALAGSNLPTPASLPSENLTPHVAMLPSPVSEKELGYAGAVVPAVQMQPADPVGSVRRRSLRASLHAMHPRVGPPVGGAIAAQSSFSLPSSSAAVFSNLSVSQTVNFANAQYQSEKLERLIKYQSTLLQQFE